MITLLCRERLGRLLRVLDQFGGSARIRTLERIHGIPWREVKQAEEFGWIRISTRAGAVGRPSVVAEKLSKNPSAKLPPYRYAVPRCIKFSHRWFAIHSVSVVAVGNHFGFGVISKTDAYLRAYPNCRSRSAAAVGASRLMKRQDVRLMRAWLYAEINGKVKGVMPMTEAELIADLEPLGVIRYRGRC